MPPAHGTPTNERMVTVLGIGKGCQKKLAKAEAARACLLKVHECSDPAFREKIIVGKPPATIINELCQAEFLPPPIFRELEPDGGNFVMECCMKIPKRYVMNVMGPDSAPRAKAVDMAQRARFESNMVPDCRPKATNSPPSGQITVIDVNESIADRLNLRPFYDWSTLYDNLPESNEREVDEKTGKSQEGDEEAGSPP